MPFIAGLIVGLVLGVCAGMLITAVCVAAARGDSHLDE